MKAALRVMGFSQPHVGDEVLLNCWDTWRDVIKRKYPDTRLDAPVYGKQPKTKLSRHNYSEQTVICSVRDLHKLMENIDTRIMEHIMLDGGHRVSED